MGLIKKILKKTAGVGVMVAGLPFAPIALAAEIPLAINASKEGEVFENIESQSKLVCVLTEKLSGELEQLNSTTFDMGDYVVTSTLEEDKQQKYEQMYDQVINSFGELESVKLISKEEFVNFMLENGEFVEEYVTSEEFMERVSELKAILNDETKTKEEKLYFLKTSVEEDNHHCGPGMSKFETVLKGALGIAMIIQGVNVIVDAFSLACMDEFESWWQLIIHFLFGMVSEMGYFIIADEN